MTLHIASKFKDRIEQNISIEITLHIESKFIDHFCYFPKIILRARLEDQYFKVHILVLIVKHVIADSIKSFN